MRKLPGFENDIEERPSPESLLWCAVVERLLDDLKSTKIEYAEEYFQNRAFLEHLVDECLGFSEKACELIKDELLRLAQLSINGELVKQKINTGAKNPRSYHRPNKLLKDQIAERERKYQVVLECIEKYNHPLSMSCFTDILEDAGIKHAVYAYFKKLKGYPLPCLDPEKTRITKTKKAREWAIRRNMAGKGGWKC